MAHSHLNVFNFPNENDAGLCVFVKVHGRLWIKVAHTEDGRIFLA